nr:DUF485 domain-containing protein [Sporichthya sp.]
MAQLEEPGRSAANTGMTPEYQALYDDPEFAELRRRFKRLVFPLLGAGLAWYALYVICATYAHDFMGEEVLGHINVGLIFGLLQFVSTFGIAFLYAKRAEVEIDPLSQALVNKFNAGGAE